MAADTGVVIGFSQLTSRSFFDRLQAYDFLTLMTAAAGTVGLGIPLAASGQNFAYRKCLFEKVGGFRDIAHRPSGDDVLLLQLLRQAWDGRIAFAADPGTYATTPSPRNAVIAVATTQAVGIQRRVSTASQPRFFFLYCSGLFDQRTHPYRISRLNNRWHIYPAPDLLGRENTGRSARRGKRHSYL